MSVAAATPAWPSLTSFSETYTCYSSALAAWAAHDESSWPRVVNPGLWLRLDDAGDGLFGFGHFPPSLRASLGLVRRGEDDGETAVCGILDEIGRSGRVIVAGDGFQLPWHVAFERRHVPHWFVLTAASEGALVVDPFACRNDLGWQEATLRPVAREDLPRLIVSLPHGDPVFVLREALAFGDDAGPLDRSRFQWFARGEVSELRVPEAYVGVDAVRRLAQHFRDQGQSPDAYRQADDLWSIARHRAFLARYASDVVDRRADRPLREWVEEHAAPLAHRWGHVSPLVMQATLALEAGRAASPSLPETLDELARREAAAEEAFPADAEAGRVSPAQLET
jgi:hypothetical protein